MDQWHKLYVCFIILSDRQVQHLHGSCPQTSGCVLHKLWRGSLCCVNKGTNTNLSLSLVLRRRICVFIYRMLQKHAVNSRMAGFLLLERDAMVSSVAAPLMINRNPGWSTAWTDPPHRFHVAGKT